MLTLQTLSCPKCGAPLDMEQSSGMALCGYCSTRSVIQQQGGHPVAQMVADEVISYITEQALQRLVQQKLELARNSLLPTCNKFFATTKRRGSIEELQNNRNEYDTDPGSANKGVGGWLKRTMRDGSESILKEAIEKQAIPRERCAIAFSNYVNYTYAMNRIEMHLDAYSHALTEPGAVQKEFIRYDLEIYPPMYQPEKYSSLKEYLEEVREYSKSVAYAMSGIDLSIMKKNVKLPGDSARKTYYFTGINENVFLFPSDSEMRAELLYHAFMSGKVTNPFLVSYRTEADLKRGFIRPTPGLTSAGKDGDLNFSKTRLPASRWKVTKLQINTANQSPAASEKRPAASSSMVDELARLAQLYQGGMITAEEFSLAKKKVMGAGTASEELVPVDPSPVAAEVGSGNFDSSALYDVVLEGAVVRLVDVIILVRKYQQVSLSEARQRINSTNRIFTCLELSQAQNALSDLEAIGELGRMEVHEK